MNLCFFFDCVLLPGGWSKNVRIEVRNGLIENVNSDTAPQQDDRRAALVIPGLSNLHSHAFQRAMAGLAEHRGPSGTDDFWGWRRIMYGFLERLDPDDIEAIAAYAYADMLEAGFTSVAEFHYLHRDPQGSLYVDPAELSLRHLAAADATGIGLTLLPVFYEASDFGGVAPTASQRRFVTDLDEFDWIVERARAGARHEMGRNVGIAPHSLRAVTTDHLTQLLRQHPTGPVHIHVAEQVREVTDCLAISGLRPVDWLLQHVEVDERWCLVHATHLTPEETTGLAQSGAVVGLCPFTEANLGDGIFPAREYSSQSGRWGIGSDSNISVDAAGELRLLEYSQRLSSRTRNSLSTVDYASTGRALYEAALKGGAQALGRRVGAILPGYRADFLVLDEHHPDLMDRTGDFVLDSWIFACGRGLIREVIAHGHTVVEGRRHRARGRIDANFRQVVSKLSR
jgi:formimidoylglutamate deiminase